jgi:hypothetical protein
MEKCDLYRKGIASVYEQVGNTTLVACPINECSCSNGIRRFTSSEDGREYNVCPTKGLVDVVNPQ